jgi:GNAT superfamily N-acetyltransferase
MIKVREAIEADVDAISEIFAEIYRGHYAHPEFCESGNLKRLIFDDDILILVAEDTGSGRVFGSASIVLDVGAFGDLIGEFGRLVVHPDGRHQGIGKKLMEGRLERVQERLHMAIVENRAVHPYSQRISAAYDFVPVGFLPSKLKFKERENIALYAKPFGACLSLRKNHPRIIPEAYALADCVLRGIGIGDDAIVDEETPAYAPSDPFAIEAMSSAGYASLLRFERGRIRNREIFGPVKLHAGVFQIRVSHYRYLLARREGRLAGGIGFHIDPAEHAARILELVSADDEPIRFLLEEAVRICRDEGRAEYIEADVNAHSPAMQRTFLELGFLPAAYIPAMSFHRVERFDVVRMVKLFAPLDLEGVELHETTQPVADIVVHAFEHSRVIPRIAAAISQATMFAGLSAEQAARVAAFCKLRKFPAGQPLATRGEAEGQAILILSGSVSVNADDSGPARLTIDAGETIGEVSLVGIHPQADTLIASSEVEAAMLEHSSVSQLVRQRPDIGVILYRNLATKLADKS